MVRRRGAEPQPLVAASTAVAVAERVGGRQVCRMGISRHHGDAARRADHDARGCVTVNHDTLGTQQAASSVDADGVGVSRRAEQGGESKKCETHGSPP